MSIQNPGVCIHGALRRQCETCDLADGLERRERELVQAQVRIAELERERDKLRKDALRYRYVRNHVSRILNEDTLKMDGLRVEAYYDEPLPYILGIVPTNEMFDTAIDAAMQEPKP